MKLLSRYRSDRADRGATLILAIIIVTVVSIVTVALLTQGDSGVRTTVGMRDEASVNYAADGAAQAALVNLLRSSNAPCISSSASVNLGSGTAAPFYTQSGAPSDGRMNAYAQCGIDPSNGASVTTIVPPPTQTTIWSTPTVTATGSVLGSGDPTLPSYALLATGSSSGDYGIDFSTSASGRVACIQNGSVASNKDISIYNAATQPASAQILAVRLDPKITLSGNASDCTSGTGVDPTTGSRLVVTAAGSCISATPATSYFKPTNCTPGAAAVQNPPAPALPGPISAVNPAPVCTAASANGKVTTYAAFSPGLYTDVSLLNAPKSPTCPGSSSGLLEWFSPGAYYFDFKQSNGSADSTPWTWPISLVAGTPTDNSGTVIPNLDASNASTLGALSNLGTAPTACQDVASTTGTVNGAEFIFGEASRIYAGNTGSSSTTAEICASSSSTSPPVAIYGLSGDATVAKAASAGGGSVTIPAQTLCSATGCGSTKIIDTGNGGQAVIYFKGYVYGPNMQMDLTLKNSTGQVFNWGVVVRDFRFYLNGASATGPFLALPKPDTAVGATTSTYPGSPTSSVSVTQPPPSPSTSYNIRDITVWTCTAGGSACPTTDSSGHPIPPNVIARVQIDPTGKVTILSWNHIRYTQTG